MAYVSTDYATNATAPKNNWICAPTSSIKPSTTAPADHTSDPDYCGQCVSFVKTLCPTLPQTKNWAPGDHVKDSTTIVEGTIIANFDSNRKYLGHAAVYVSKDKDGINVWDQWITGDHPKAIGPRKIRYGGSGSSNDGNLFYVVT